MRRRDVIALLGGAAPAWPMAARAQQPERVRRIGVLGGSAENDPEIQPRVAALQQGLEALGWVEGRNVRIDYRWAAGDANRIRAHATELVSQNPDVILATPTPIVAALRQATGTIPIVFVAVSDPVYFGFVASYAHPGGNITGFSNYAPAIGGKWLELLKEVAPGIARVAVIFNPDTAPDAIFLPAISAAAPLFAVELISAPVRNAAEIESAIAALGREPGGGLISIPDVFSSAHRGPIIALAARHRVPAVYPFRFFATSGGLMSYGADVVDQFRRAATYIDRILNGTNPAELPVQAPSKFEFVFNLKTANALGLTAPASLLARADDVIE